jgi:hypothetical protein
MKFNSQSAASHAEFRENTEKHKTFAGVMRPSFICRRCGQSRGTTGRQQAVKGDRCSGWVCGTCVKEKQANAV